MSVERRTDALPSRRGGLPPFWVVLTCALAISIGTMGRRGPDGHRVVTFLVLIAVAVFIYLHSRKTAVRAGNVNEEWAGEGGSTRIEPRW
jgi:hypothetical protein